MILVRWETTPDDIHGMIAAKGILTVRQDDVACCGRRARHGQAVRRRLRGRVDRPEGTHRADRRGRPSRRRRDPIDGGTGRVIIGAVDLVPPQINEHFQTVLGWADEIRTARARNADNPEDAARRASSERGIGLCRTEHMFFGDERLLVVQEMIMATDEARPAPGARAAAADAAVRFQRSSRSCRGCRSRSGCSIPPLHEFLPSPDEARDDRMRERIRQLQEANPMLGTRPGAGSVSSFRRSTRCRSVRSFVRHAPCRCAQTKAPLVEIMHPLVGFAEELQAAPRADGFDRERRG